MADKLFTWGANSYGQLGVGSKEDATLPVDCVLPLPGDVRLKQVSGGGGHTMILTADGGVLAFGWNKDGQLGLEASDEVTVPRPLQMNAAIEKVACGWNHTLAVTRGGSLMVWGANAYGQLGISEARQLHHPTEMAPKLLGNSRVCDVAAGLRHSVVVTEGGVVYCWGDGRKGQLGSGRSTGVVPLPQPVPLPFPCISCSAGSYHSAVLSVQGNMMLWGLNQDGQCGVSPCGRGTVVSPHHLQGLPPVERVSCGWSHTIALCVDRCVMVWGRCDYGQLGLEPHLLPTEGRYSHQPTELFPLRGAKQVTCGSEHNIALLGSGEVLTWGWNEHGMCGTGDEENVFTPYALQLPVRGQVDTVLVGSGSGHTMLVVKGNCR